jgi:hypothetical protein
MVQHSETAGSPPTEQSPLLTKTGSADAQGEAYVTIAAVSPEGTLNGIEDSASVKSGSDDEESQGHGEVEEGIGRSHVARIISILLIGESSPCPLFSSNTQWLTEGRYLCRPRRWIHSPGYAPRHCVRVQRPGQFELADHQLYVGWGCHSDSGKYIPTLVLLVH